MFQQGLVDFSSIPFTKEEIEPSADEIYGSDWPVNAIAGFIGPIGVPRKGLPAC